MHYQFNRNYPSCIALQPAGGREWTTTRDNHWVFCSPAGFAHTKLVNRVCRLLGICSRIDSRLDIRTAASGDGCVHMPKCIYRRTEGAARACCLAFACIQFWGNRPIVRGTVTRLRWRSVKSTLHFSTSYSRPSRSSFLYDANIHAVPRLYLLLAVSRHRLHFLFVRFWGARQRG